MQPPTEPAHRPQPPAPRGDEDRLYRQHHRELHRAVARVVRAPRELIEDACQTAWANPPAHPARPLRDLRLAARRRHPRGLPPRRHRPTCATPRAPQHRRARLAGADRRSTDARRGRRCSRSSPHAGFAARAPAQRPHAARSPATATRRSARSRRGGRSPTSASRSSRPARGSAARATLVPDACCRGPNRTAVPLVV